MNFYGRAWVREGSIYTVNTTTKFLAMDTVLDWSDEIFDLEIEGPYQNAADVMARLNYVDGQITSNDLDVRVVNKRAGIPRDIEAELAELRATLRLSFAQLLIGLVSEQWITAEEGKAWRDRVALPAQVQALIDALPPEQQFAAETRALAPSEILRNDQLVIEMGKAAGKTAEEMDEFFRTYATV